ncbi:putative choline transporter, neither null mutation nor overexpression affects choline transport [Phlyctochytrium planicorne]|nr:putative choline transporter, neither null mutation nor overexpression affects choline transport [Phlyctochytrium planicorne]
MSKQFEERMPAKSKDGHAASAASGSSLMPPPYVDDLSRPSISSESQPLLSEQENHSANPKWFAPVQEKKDPFFANLFYVNTAIFLTFSAIGAAFIGVIVNRFSKMPPPPPSPEGDGWMRSLHRRAVSAMSGPPATDPKPIEIHLTMVQALVLIFGTIGLSILSSVIYYFLVTRLKGKFVKFGVIFSLALVGLLLVPAVILKRIPSIITLSIFIILFGIVAYRIFFRKSIVLNMFDAVADVLASSPGMVGASVVATITAFALSISFFLALCGLALLLGAAGAANPGPKSLGFVGIAVGLYLTFSFIWIANVIQNVLATTVAGVYATYHLTGVADENGKVSVPMRRPVTAAAKRALGPSFGSIALGSLILSLLEWLSGLLNRGNQESISEGNSTALLIFCCLKCLADMFKDLLQFLNRYSFTYVAIYGESYFTSAKSAFNLIKEQGLDVVSKDAGIILAVMATVLPTMMLSTFLGTAIFTLGFGVPFFLAYFALILAVAIDISVITQILRAGATATIVCLAEDPVALSRTRPELVECIVALYSEIPFTGAVTVV